MDSHSARLPGLIIVALRMTSANQKHMVVLVLEIFKLPTKQKPNTNSAWKIVSGHHPHLIAILKAKYYLCKFLEYSAWNKIGVLASISESETSPSQELHSSDP